MNRVVLFRSVGFGVGATLAVVAALQIVIDITRPQFRTSDFFFDGTRPSTSGTVDSFAASILARGDVLADTAALGARQALDTANGPNRATANSDAQRGMASALSVSPVNAAAWLVLGQLKAQMGEPAAASVKMSYFTGAIPPNAVSARIRSVVTTSAATDDDIRLLAQSDVRTILTRYAKLEPALAATYRQATPDGKKLLIDTTQAVDPRFSKLLEQYP